MIVVDANLLIYAHSKASPHNEQARAWWERTTNEAPLIGIPWVCILAFIRLMTTQQLKTGVGMPAALATVDQWLALPAVVPLAPGGGHWLILSEMIRKGQVAGPSSTDAHLAALAIENGGVLHTHDRGFARFPRLKWTDPLAQ